MQGLEVGQWEGEGAPSHEGRGGGGQCSGGFSPPVSCICPRLVSRSAAEAEQEGLAFVVKDHSL